MEGIYLALDAGIGAGRCVAFDSTGAVQVSAYREWTYTRFSSGQNVVEFDADEFWATLRGVIHETIEQLPGGAESIRGISTTCMREGFVLIDETGREIYSAPSFDERGRRYNDALADENGDGVFAETGHWPAALHAPGRILMMKEQEPERWSRARHLLMIGDWIIYKLTGERAGEASNLCSTLMIRAQDRAYSGMMLSRLGVDEDMLPPIGETGDVVGGVSSEASRETGLRAGTPVVIGGGDSQCGVLGLGAVSHGEIGIIAGTTTPVLQVVNAPIIDPDRRVWTRCHVDRRQWCLESNAGMTGIAFRWIRDAFITPFMGTGDAANGDSYTRMAEMAHGSPIGSRGVSALFPSVMDAKKIDYLFEPRGIVGLPPMQGDEVGLADVIRATMEAIAFAVRANIEQLERVSDTIAPAIKICGGQAKNAFWLQMQADVLQRPLVVSTSEESTAFGAAIAAAYGIGDYDSLATAATALSGGRIVEPEETTSREYDQPYGRWLDRYERWAAMQG